jgi:PIN domain nuclease of toxin-antitoxin system
MRVLLDTHLLLWAAARSRRLPSVARGILEEPRNEVFFSAASLWEIAIKSGLRRSDFVVDVALLRSALREMGLIELPVSGAHAERVVGLPRLHNDPFDRMLVAQSLYEPLVLLTNDRALAAYGPSVRVVA